jgi:hypothetical protein
MRRIVFITFFFISLFGFGFIGSAYGFQAPSAWVDANGVPHSSSSAQSGPAQSTGTYVPPSYVAPGRTARTPEPVSAPKTGLSFIQWQDPAENAFSASLPRGWQISGGTVRATQLDVHYVIHAQSPDGGVQMFNDDPRILMREVPNQETQMMGWREGQPIPSGGGGKVLLERYQPAPQAAQSYIRQALCPSATMMQGGIIPGQTQDLNRVYGEIARSEGKTVHVDAGEVSFKCGDRVGYVYAITLQAWQPGGPVSIWAIYRIAGYLATTADSASAAAAMHTLLGTFQMNQQWLQNFARECNDFAGNVIRESNAVTQATIQRAQQQDAEEQSQYDDWKKNSDARFNAIEGANNAITGANQPSNDGSGHDYNAQLDTKTVCDDLGRCQSVDATVTNWYSDCSGTFYAGSEAGGPPPASESACWSKGH